MTEMDRNYCERVDRAYRRGRYAREDLHSHSARYGAELNNRATIWRSPQPAPGAWNSAELRAEFAAEPLVGVPRAPEAAAPVQQAMPVEFATAADVRALAEQMRALSEQIAAIRHAPSEAGSPTVKDGGAARRRSD
jgi:hypothetical protein